MKIRLRLDAPCFAPAPVMCRVVQWAVEALTMADRIIIASGLVPPIYESGVKYQEEPNYSFGEDFADAYVCYKRGWMDCDDAAAWRCAELLEAGEKAGIRVSYKPHPDRRGRLYHVTVRRADGSIEDPSLKTGMMGGSEYTAGPRAPEFGFVGDVKTLAKANENLKRAQLKRLLLKRAERAALPVSRRRQSRSPTTYIY